jgi:hypothetical protein
MAIFASKVFVQPPVEARAESTELIEQTLGVKVLPALPGQIRRQGITQYRRAGGRKGGYCPVTN